MVRKTWPGYVALYKSKRGDKIIVRSVTYPPETRKFKVAGGLRVFRRVKFKQSLQEVIIVARATKKPAKKAPAKKRGASRRKKQEEVEVTDDEIDELESVDELDEDEDDDLEEEDDDLDEDEEDEDDEPEDEDEDEDDEDDEEDEEPPKRAKKPRQSRAAADGLIGTNEIAEKAGVDSRTLRMVLRKHKVAKDPETRRYQWPSWKNKTVVKILKWLEEGEADDVKTESLEKLKKSQETKASKKKTKKPAAKKRRRRVVEEEDEDDE